MKEFKKSPYEAVFGSTQRIGLADSSLERETYAKILESFNHVKNAV
jgi:hypothetical protein